MLSFWNIEDLFSKESFYNETFLEKKITLLERTIV